MVSEIYEFFIDYGVVVFSVDVVDFEILVVV